MNEIYIVDGKKYRVGLINKDDFLAKNPKAELFVEEEKEFGPQKEGKTSTTELDTTVDATEVSDTGSPSVDGSSESARTSVRSKTRKSDLSKIEDKKRKKFTKDEVFDTDFLADLPGGDKPALATAGDLYKKDKNRLKELENNRKLEEQKIIKNVTNVEDQIKMIDDLNSNNKTEIKQIEDRNSVMTSAIKQMRKDVNTEGSLSELISFNYAANKENTRLSDKEKKEEAERLNIPLSEVGDLRYQDIELDTEVEGNIIDAANDLNIPLQKIAEGRISIEEKEQLVNAAKTKALNTIIPEKIDEYSKEYRNQLDRLKLLDDKIKSSKVTAKSSSKEVKDHNETIKLYNDLLASTKEQNEDFNKNINTLKAKYIVSNGEKIINNYKTSNKIEDYNKSMEDSPYKNAAAKFANGMYSLFKQGSVALPQLGIRGLGAAYDFLGGDLQGGEDTYNYFDAFADQLGVVAGKDLGLPETDKFTIVDKEGKFNWTGANIANDFAEAVPFSLYIMQAAAKGDMNKATKLISNAYKKGKYVSNAQKSQLIVVQQAFKATVDANIAEGKRMGLNDSQALTFGTNLALAEGMIETILPEQAMVTAGSKVIKAGLFKNLKNTANIKSAKNAAGRFIGNIGLNTLEEELNFAYSEMLKLNTGLISQSNFLTDLTAHKKLVASSVVLSAGLGSVGAYKDFNRSKDLIYKEIIDQSKGMLDVINAEIENLPRDQNGEVLEESKQTLDQLNEARVFTTDLVRASKISPENVSAEQLDLVVQKQKLIDQKKKLDNSFHAPINEEIEAVDKKIAESKVTQTKEETAAKLKKGVDALGKKLGFAPKRLKDNAAVEEYLNDIRPGEDNVKRAGNFGVFVTKPDGTKELIINEEANAKEGVITTEAHEALHFILYEAVKNSPETQKALGEALLNELGKIDTGQIADSQYERRLDSYLADPDVSEGDSFEEALTLFSEATLNGDIVYNENVMTKIGDYIRQTLQSIGFEQAIFNDGRDVFNFIKDYNNSIKKGRADNFITDVAKKPVGKLVKPKVDKTQTDEQIVKDSRSEEASTKVQELYDTQGEAAAFDIIEQFKPITSKIVEKRSEAPGFDRQLLTDEIETGKRGILDLIKEYKPESGVPLAAYINKFLPARAIEASRRILGEEFTDDVTEAKGVAAEEVSIAEAPTDKQTTSKLRRVLGIKQGDEIYDLAKKVSGEIMTGDLPGKKVKTAVNREARKSELRKAVSNLMGTEKAIDEQFLNKNILEVLKALPASDLVKLEREAKVKVLAEQGPRLNVKDAREAVNKGVLPKDTNLQSGPKVSSKLPTTLEQAKEFFTQKRKAGLVNVVTEMLVKDAAPEVTEGKVEPAKRAKVLSEIDRAPTLKFSKDYKSIAALKVNNDAKGQPLFRPSNIKLVRKEIMKFFGVDYVNKKDTGKAYSTRNRNAKLPENIANKQGETFIEGSTRIVGDFLEENPKWRNALRASTTAGVERGLFTTTKVFEKLFPLKKGVKQEGIRYGYTGKGKLLSEKFANSTKEKDFVENQYKQIDNLIDFFSDVETYLKKNPKDAWVFDAIVKDAQDNQNSIFRSSAPILFLATDSKGNLLFNVPLRQEHSMPQNNVSTMLLDMAINGRVKQDSKVIKATYMQGGLTMADDGLLDVDYKFTMPEVYWNEVFPRILSGDLKLPNGLAAVIRMTESGVNLDNLKYLVTGKSISEFFFDTKGVPVEMQKELISDYFTGKKDLKLIKDIAAKRVLINPSQIKASKSNNDKSAFKFSKAPTNKVTIETAATTDKALNIARDLDAPVKKIRVFDFDDTLAQTKSDVLYTMPDGTEGKLNAEQFASEGSTLLSEGAVFDFSEFNKVTEGKKGPLFKVAQTIAAKRGTEDVFVLTARAPESQLAIYEFLKSQGLDIPLKNITGLGNSTGEAKARWIVDKAADGYNDFYFADDAPQNVKAVKDALSVIDVKSKTQQAKIKFSKSLDLNKDFNDIIENKTGIGSDKIYSKVKAEVAGANKGRFNFFIPPSAEDFVGLLYSTLGKGDVGDAQMAWYKSHLLNPFARAMENLANDRAAMMQDFRGLKKGLGIVPKNLRKKIKDSNFTKEQAVRVYIWDKQGMEIPGISKKDQKDLVDFVNADAELVVFGDQLIEIGKGDDYAAPDAGWVAGTIDTDFIKALNTTKRSKYLETWQQNVDQIFSEANLNKLEAAYGANYREAMVDILKRMKTGRNTSSGSDRLAARFTDWLTNSVGAIMFFNTRSAVLQTISAVNFINFSDNNVLKAGQAFANQPQYWSDFKKLFNSPFLLDRRSGLKLNVNEADIAQMAKGPGNSARNVIAGILKAGFLPTQIADSFAIASGGASFYRNRIKALQKEGLTEAEAEEQAFRDFREIAEESQQSSRPDKISQQQAGPLGRVVLAFANTPAQYARLIKKAASDLKNGRGDAKTNISKIIYYGVAQNLLFSALQQALFAIAFDDEEEDEKKNEKYFNIVNGMSDSILRGIGVGGAVASVVKNTAIRLAKEADKKSPKYQDAVVKGVLQISPPVSSKVGKLQSAGRSFSWNQEEMRTRGWSIDNPAYLASANVISAATNVPLDRAVKKVTNIVDAGNEDIEYYKRVALALGWSAWELGIDKKGGKVAPPKTDMDKLYDLNKKQQIDSLLSLGISKKQIKALKLEEDRVKAILDPKSVKKIKVSKRDSLFGLNKKDQVKALEKLGLTKKEIRALRLESDRVEAIINKQKKEVE